LDRIGLDWIGLAWIELDVYRWYSMRGGDFSIATPY